jgi:GNAT superfamily N-acetyltransferase
MELVIETEPDLGNVQFLRERLHEYNVARTGIDDGKLLAIFLRDDAGDIFAGLYGWTWGECLDVQLLWVREDARGRGHGRHLLQAAEREAVARGCRQATLDTHCFQAPEFYRMLGYQFVGGLEGYPRGHRKHYLRKEFA